MILFPKDKDKLPMLYQFKNNSNTVKPVYNDHPRDKEKVHILGGGRYSELSNYFFDLKNS